MPKIRFFNEDGEKIDEQGTYVVEISTDMGWSMSAPGVTVPDEAVEMRFTIPERARDEK